MTTWLGLTGGTAVGKSTIANFFADQSVPVVDADQVARQLVTPGTPGLTALISEFGPEIVAENGTLDRKMLGQLVFHQPAELTRLNRVMAPLLLPEILRRMKRERNSELVVLDAPTLFEAGYVPLMDLTMVVVLSPAKQLERLMARDGLDQQAAAERIASQWSPSFKASQADVVIDSSGTIAKTRKKVLKWLDDTDFSG
ncbi:dephospho-CoA kinase [Levilactobacillus bambusae]|uniref:Dephospho-CoA kinase n=1 Tax=Levilactobacillus bambusae TaxID=2024736 RepID=A0A2V1N1B9_9LACO|nr:dephospho-CoA kinase [Levilactobacillus bambusae]PWG01037.1 dephospho-CoA kinase [Levilactobacillus bambusae]